MRGGRARERTTPPPPAVSSRRVADRPHSLSEPNPSFLLRYLVKRARFATPLLSGRPAVTYACYRTASTAVHHAIRRAGLGVSVKAHMLAPGNMVGRVRERQSFAHAGRSIPKSCHVGDWAVRRGILEPGREADFVVLLRDPWAVAHSLFVLAIAQRDTVFATPPRDAGERAQLVDRAEAILFGEFPRDIMVRWIREDLRPALGWDPLAEPFDLDRGASGYEHGPWRIQLMRADIPDERKSDALRAFFRRPSISVAPKNAALSHRHTRSEIADIAREAIARRPHEVAALLDDEVCRHFWSDRERGSMHARWTSTQHA